jgi:hypothetical protein
MEQKENPLSRKFSLFLIRLKRKVEIAKSQDFHFFDEDTQN